MILRYFLRYFLRNFYVYLWQNMDENDTKYLESREGIWFFVRKNPKKLKHLLGNKLFERFTLQTRNLEIAQDKRNGFIKKQKSYWAHLYLTGKPDQDLEGSYQAVINAAKAVHIEYKDINEILSEKRIDTLMTRLEILEQNRQIPDPNLSKAVLGISDKPNPTMSKVLKFYLDKILPDKLMTKSPRQKQHVINPKKRVIRNFIKLCGDIPIYDVNRSHALEYYEWLQDRVADEDNPLATDSANKYISQIRGIFLDYFKYNGDDDLLDPFRNLWFTGGISRKVLPFKTSYIENLIQNPEILADLAIASRIVIAAFINTGLRHSEICNLRSDSIYLDTPTPYVDIVQQSGRDLKTKESVRQLPLFGISLEAFKLIKNGAIDCYKDKSDTFSANANKFFRHNGLFPDVKDEKLETYRIYSLRHSFRDRMIEAGVDVDIRDKSMGHKIYKPEYGNYGEIELRMKLLKEIDIEYDPKFFN